MLSCFEKEVQLIHLFIIVWNSLLIECNIYYINIRIITFTFHFEDN